MEYFPIKQERARFSTAHAEYEYITLTVGNNLPWLILLHGFMGSAQTLLTCTEFLEGKVNLLLPSLPGHGETVVYSSKAFAPEIQSAAIVALANHVTESRCFVHGYSMGGRLALYLSLIDGYQDHFSGFIFESTTAGISSANERAERVVADAKRAHELIYHPDVFFEFWENLPLFNGGVKTARHEAYQRRQKLNQATSLADSLSFFGTGVFPDLWSSLTSLRLPVLLLCGALDTKFCALADELLKQIPQASKIEVKEAAHRVHLDQPKLWAQHILTFITQNTVLS